MRLALSPDGHAFSSPTILPTPANFAEALTVMRALAGEQKLAVVAGGIAGTWDAALARLTNSPHLPGWVGVPIKEQLAAAFNCPVFVENDTALVGLGEAQTYRDQIVAYLTISTGVGGARIVNGRIDEHTHSFEPGRQIIDYHQPTKHFEDYISGAAVLAATGRSPKEVTDQAFWQDLSKIAAVGIYNTALEWTPEIIILGGGMMGSPGLDLETIKSEFARLAADLPVLPEIRRATLGDLGGLHGALVYLKQKSSQLN